MNADSQDDDDHKLIYFPSLAERDQLRKTQQQKKDQEKEAKPGASGEKKSAAPREPFLNWAKIPPFTGGVALVFTTVQIIVSFLLTPDQILQLYYTLGFVPANFSSLAFLNQPWGIIYLLSPFTYSFLHGSWMHLVFNMVMWLALGTFFEKEFGSLRAAQFFLLCGAGGALVHFAVAPFSEQAVIGASASISGCFAVALVLLFRRGMMGPRGKNGIMPLLLFWLGLMTLLGIAGGGMGENVAWVAHLGGFLTGLLYITRRIRSDFKFWSL